MPSDNNLHKAAHKGDIEECKKYIEDPDEGDDPIDVNSPGASDRRPIHRAAGAGHADLCAYFLDKGAQINLPDKSGRTALHWAAISGFADVVRLLLQRGANMLAVTSNQMTALHGACEAGRVDAVKALMEHVQNDEAARNAMTMMKNADGKTAWDVAVGTKSKALCTVLKEMGDVNGASSSCVIS